MAKKPQIPLNDVMLAIDRKNRSWYDNLYRRAEEGIQRLDDDAIC